MREVLAEESELFSWCVCNLRFIDKARLMARGEKTVVRRVAVSFVLGLAFAAGGCAAPVEEAPEASDSPYGGFPVDPPGADETVLTLEGARAVDLSLDQLRAMPSTSVTILEPFVQDTVTFEGVELDYLIAQADIDPGATLETVALNDYIFEDSATALVDAGAIVAYAEDGGVIAMDKGGPVRIVFAEESPYFDFLDAWNWSLRTIRELPE